MNQAELQDIEWLDEDYVVIENGGEGLMLTKNYKGAYSVTAISEDWLPERDGFPMIKGW